MAVGRALPGLAAAAALAVSWPAETARAADFGQQAAPPATGRLHGKARPARPKMTLPELVSDKDYPAAAKRSRQEGSVTFKADVGRDGRIAACTIVGSSGSALLDATTCRLVRARGRFAPARDARGKPTTDTVFGRIIWTLGPGA